MPRLLLIFSAIVMCSILNGACAFDGRASFGGEGNGDASAPSAPNDFSREFAAKENNSIRIKNSSSDITLRGTDANRIVVRGIKEGRDRDRVEVIDKSGDDRIDLGVRYNCRNCQASVRFEVEVPRGVRLRFDDISTASGNVRIEDVTGDVEAETASGDVRVSNVTGKIEASSASGNVEVENVAGEVSAKTASGDVDVLIKELTGTSDLKFSTASGDVKVAVPANTNADVEMQTMSGSVKNEFGLQVERPQYGPGASVEGRIGSGGRSLKISAASGDVELLKS